MHPGPPPQTYKAPPPVQDDGGEGEHPSNEVEMTSSSEAIDLLQRTQASLAESNLRLHKFARTLKQSWRHSVPRIVQQPLKTLILVVKNLSRSEV
ncbi:hypothetical protein D4764_0155000 [Takifugu flavidus]|uniref:Uncharacterized protein n=1 Tax=Takifugu flavidus TaxID=433684 RepID=A0A5C6MJ99_9TELE|nr:hypothetical protein D4764_0155000 [Takifugu flavidus]